MADSLALNLQQIVLDEQSRAAGMYTYFTLYNRLNMIKSRFSHNAKLSVSVPHFNEYQIKLKVIKGENVT